MKKLERVDGLLFGVCAGAGDYLGVDPTVIRVLWTIASIVTMSAAVILYVALVLVIPRREDGTPPTSESGA